MWLNPANNNRLWSKQYEQQYLWTLDSGKQWKSILLRLLDNIYHWSRAQSIRDWLRFQHQRWRQRQFSALRVAYTYAEDMAFKYGTVCNITEQRLRE